MYLALNKLRLARKCLINPLFTWGSCQSSFYQPWGATPRFSAPCCLPRQADPLGSGIFVSIQNFLQKRHRLPITRTKKGVIILPFSRSSACPGRQSPPGGRHFLKKKKEEDWIQVPFKCSQPALNTFMLQFVFLFFFVFASFLFLTRSSEWVRGLNF